MGQIRDQVAPPLLNILQFGGHAVEAMRQLIKLKDLLGWHALLPVSCGKILGDVFHLNEGLHNSARHQITQDPCRRSSYNDGPIRTPIPGRLKSLNEIAP